MTIQAQILDLMERLRQDLGTAIIMITHDLGVIAEISHRVVVIYAGKIMEQTSTLELFDRPLHPYTQGLMQAIPSPEATRKTQELYEIQGVVPSLPAIPGMPVSSPLSSCSGYLQREGAGPDGDHCEPLGRMLDGRECLRCFEVGTW